jgi:hypothetical protein
MSNVNAISWPVRDPCVTSRLGEGGSGVGLGVAVGVGFGVGLGDGVGDSIGLGDGDGVTTDGDGAVDRDGEGDGDGAMADGDGAGDGDGDGTGVQVGSADGVAIGGLAALDGAGDAIDGDGFEPPGPTVHAATSAPAATSASSERHRFRSDRVPITPTLDLTGARRPRRKGRNDRAEQPSGRGRQPR